MTWAGDMTDLPHGRTKLNPKNKIRDQNESKNKIRDRIIILALLPQCVILPNVASSLRVVGSHG